MSKWSRSISRLEQFVSNGFEVNIKILGKVYALTIMSILDVRNACTINNTDLSDAIDIMYEKFYLESLKFRKEKNDD